MDVISIAVSLYRLKQANQRFHGDGNSDKSGRLREIEKKELIKRIKETILKYLIRDPIFEDYTKVYIAKLF
jgi:hypothetical protein